MTTPRSPRELGGLVQAIEVDLGAALAMYASLHDTAYNSMASWRAEDVSLVGLSDPTAVCALDGWGWLRSGLAEASGAVQQAATASAQARAALRSLDRSLQLGSVVGRSWCPPPPRTAALERGVHRRPEAQAGLFAAATSNCRNAVAATEQSMAPRN